MESETRGLLITFEGMGGSGKSTIVARVVDWLVQHGIGVVKTREPGGTPLGGRLRTLLLEGSPPTPWGEAFLFETDRAQTYADVIIPALQRGQVVVSDRNLYGTIAYQGFGRGLDVDLIDRMNSVATFGRVPDLVFVMDVDPLKGLERKFGSGAQDRFDEEGPEFQHRVREGYLFAARRDAPRASVIDANRDADAVMAEVTTAIRAILVDRGFIFADSGGTGDRA